MDARIPVVMLEVMYQFLEAFSKDFVLQRRFSRSGFSCKDDESAFSAADIFFSFFSCRKALILSS